jgi:quinol monooxygenase YgiN
VKKIILEGYILVPPVDLEVVSSELPVHIELTKKEEGCLVFEVSQDQGNLLKFHVYEEFTSQAAFEDHQARVKASRWGAITKNVERNYEITSLVSNSER